MPISAEITAADSLLQTLEQLSQQGAKKAVKRASKRAAVAARTAGTKAIRSIYTIKSGNLKARTQMRSRFPSIKRCCASTACSCPLSAMEAAGWPGLLL